MSANKHNPLQDYISGASKIHGDDRFREDMLDRIEGHSYNTVSGVERITHRPSQTPRRIAVIAAVFCCVIGISVFASNSFRNVFDPKVPGDSFSDSYMGQDSVGSWDSQSGPSDFDVSDAVLAQLAMVEEQITQYEEKSADGTLTDGDRAAMGELESQKEMLLQELCRSGEYMIAYAGYCEGMKRIRLTVVNGGDGEVFIPRYYILGDQHMAPPRVSGLCVFTGDNWNIGVIPEHSWTTVYCYPLLSGEAFDGSTQPMTLGLGTYSIMLSDHLFDTTDHSLLTELTLHSKLQITFDESGDKLDRKDISDLYDSSIDHITLDELGDVLFESYNAGDSRTVTCQKMYDAILAHNGRPDQTQSGIWEDVYFIGDEGTSAVFRALDNCYYCFTPDWGTNYASLDWFGSFGEFPIED